MVINNKNLLPLSGLRIMYSHFKGLRITWDVSFMRQKKIVCRAYVCPAAYVTRVY